MTTKDDFLQSGEAPASATSFTRDQIASIQRGRIVRAVIEVVAERGSAQTSVDRVCRQAGVSRATFYEQFDNRDSALLAAFDSGVARARALVSDRVARGEDWRSSVREGLAALLALLDQEPAVARLLIVESPSSSSGMISRRGEIALELEKLIDLGRVAPGAGEDPPVTAAAGTVGAVFFVIHSRLAEQGKEPLTALLGQLMSLIVLPYLGADAAREELARAPVKSLGTQAEPSPAAVDSLGALGLRLTYRTVRCLTFIAAHPRSSSREVADGAGVADQGQMSKLLRRLEAAGLVVERSGNVRGTRRAWMLTERGERIVEAIKADSEQWSE